MKSTCLILFCYLSLIFGLIIEPSATQRTLFVDTKSIYDGEYNCSEPLESGHRDLLKFDILIYNDQENTFFLNESSIIIYAELLEGNMTLANTTFVINHVRDTYCPNSGITHWTYASNRIGSSCYFKSSKYMACQWFDITNITNNGSWDLSLSLDGSTTTITFDLNDLTYVIDRKMQRVVQISIFFLAVIILVFVLPTFKNKFD